MGITGLDKQHAMLMLTLDRSLSGAAKAVGCVLIDRRNLETGLCYPSIELIATETQFNVRTIKRALTELKRVDWISWRRQGRSNHYEINWSRSRALQNARDSRIARFQDERDQGQKGDKTVTYQTPQTGDKTVTLSEAKGDIPGAKGDSGVTYKGDSGATLTLEDKPRNITREIPPSAEAGASFKNDIDEIKANQSDTERVGETTTVAQQSGGAHQDPADDPIATRVAAIKACKRDLSNMNRNGDSLFELLDDNAAIDAYLAEMANAGDGAVFILKHLKRDRAAAAASTDAKAVDFDDSGEQAAAE